MLNSILRTQGGKGNEGRFIERDAYSICAAGLPTAQPDDHVGLHLKHYLLNDEVNDHSILTVPTRDEPEMFPEYHDMSLRNAGAYPVIREYMSPTHNKKFEDLTLELKNTALDSYWHKPLGASHDNVPFLPLDFDPPAYGTLKLSDNIPKSMTHKLNSGKQDYWKCLAHLNTLRSKFLSEHLDEKFFRMFYMHLKYLDKTNGGWLPKDIVYKYCSEQKIKVIPSLIEPLLEMWNCFDGTHIQYEVFVYIINYKRPSLPLPLKIPDIKAKCSGYSTTYNDMMKPGQELDKRPTAGLPSGW